MFKDLNTSAGGRLFGLILPLRKSDQEENILCELCVSAVILKLLFRGIEVAEFKFRKFLSDLLQQIFHPQGLIRGGHRVHYLKVSQGIKVQISPLNHLNRVLV